MNKTVITFRCKQCGHKYGIDRSDTFVRECIDRCPICDSSQVEKDLDVEEQKNLTKQQ